LVKGAERTSSDKAVNVEKGRGGAIAKKWAYALRKKIYCERGRRRDARQLDEKPSQGDKADKKSIEKGPTYRAYNIQRSSKTRVTGSICEMLEKTHQGRETQEAKRQAREKKAEKKD